MELDGVEPRVLTEDLRTVLLEELSRFDADQGDSVALVADKASTSTRTIYRILGQRTKGTDLALADRILIAVGRHLSECRVLWPDGTVENPLG